MTSFIKNLRDRLSVALPGEMAQNIMAPLHSESYRQLREDHKVACVVLLLHFDLDKPHLTFIQRANNHPHDKHRGQISFPGGKMDEIDDSLVSCALRELQEELGIDPDKVDILGQLTPLYVYVSNFLVYPFIGFIRQKPFYFPEEKEVSQVFDVPLDYFLKEEIIKNKNIEAHGRILKDTPCYDLNEHTLWGASAMILSEFLTLFREDFHSNC